MKSLKFIVLTLLVFSTTNCNQVRDNFDWGLVEEGVYINKFFGMEWPMPKGWHYDDTFAEQWAKVNREEFVRLAQSAYESKQRIAQPHEGVQESFLFMLNKKDIENGQQDNPTIFLYAENLAYIEGAQIDDLEDYMAQTVKESKANPSVTLDSEDYEKERVGGTTFYKLTGVRTDGGASYKEHYYLTLLNGFGFGMLLRADDDAGIAKLEEVMGGISF